MPLAKEVAQEFRKLADALDTIADATVTQPYVTFYHYAENEKDGFLALAKVFPRPFTKTYEDGERGDIILQHETPAVRIRALIKRSAVCRIVEPAKPAVYDCTPLLSAEEESSLEHSEVA